MTIKEKIEKNSEFTYGVHAGFLAAHVPDNRASIYGVEHTRKVLEALDKGLMGSVRSLNHEHELLRQSIAYTLPHQIDHKADVRFMVYLRTKKNVGANGEEQLAQKLSLAPAGHLTRPDLRYYFLGDKEMAVESEVIDYQSTLKANHDRELDEEVTYETYSESEGYGERKMAKVLESHPIGFVMDSKPERGYVGNIHFGVVHLVRIPATALARMNEHFNEFVGWFTPEQLIAHITTPAESEVNKDGVEFEPWSRMLIENIGHVVKEARWLAGGHDAVKLAE